MYQKTYYVDKLTDTFADTLAAYGLATILGAIATDEEIDIRIQDQGYCYNIGLEAAIQPSWLENKTFLEVGIPFILTPTMKKKDKYPQNITKWVDYEAEKKRRAAYFEARKLLPAEARRPGATADEFPMLIEVDQKKPHSDWNIWAQVNQMSALNAYNGMVEAWDESRVCFAELLKLILQMCATSPNDIEGAKKGWKQLAKTHNLSAKVEATVTQVYNPSCGKGANRAKADALGTLSIDNLKNFWLWEYLKLVGMPRAGLPRVISGSKDRKTYVLLPVNITLNTSNTIFKRFQENFWASSAIKMDILAALKYTQLFLEQWVAGQLSEFDKFMDVQPGNYVKGLAMVFYKDMGSALAVLNQSTINLPRWLKQVSTKEDAQQFLDLLAEHSAIIQMLKEDRNLEYEMLRKYRDFISGGDLAVFFDFCGLYCSHLTNKIENKDYVKQFTISNLEVLVKNKDAKLKPILENEGFINIANAIRQSTVNAQWAKIKNKRVYEVRYGLGNDLKRKANYNDEFVQALTDFMHIYNQENVQMAERLKDKLSHYRTPITFNDLNQIVDLIDTFGAKTVGNMLVAAGYAKFSKDE